jgi:hypothetical protein
MGWGSWLATAAMAPFTWIVRKRLGPVVELSDQVEPRYLLACRSPDDGLLLSMLHHRRRHAYTLRAARCRPGGAQECLPPVDWVPETLGGGPPLHLWRLIKETGRLYHDQGYEVTFLTLPGGLSPDELHARLISTGLFYSRRDAKAAGDRQGVVP